MKHNLSPVIFWHSDPVGPDETLVLSGGMFGEGATVELALLQAGVKLNWTTVKPLQASDVSLKAVIPANWKQGIYACRVKRGEQVSKTVFVNAPDVWWKQGDEGIDKARTGGWLRLLGKCLAIEGKATVALRSENAGDVNLELEHVSCFSLKAKIPASLTAGRYTVITGNGTGDKEGQREAGILEVLPAKAAAKVVLNILDLGADPTGMKDCTLSIVQATERITSLGGA